MTTARQEDVVENPISNDFYRDRYQSVILALLIEIVLLLVLSVVVAYQVFHRPLSTFSAVSPKGDVLPLTSHMGPNLLPGTLITWASKAAVAAYSFDFANYETQIAMARPYFTDSGWSEYLASINPVIQSVVQNLLSVNGVVSGPPVMSNQGELPGRGYAWRIQMPFLVTYASTEKTVRKTFTVLITIIKVPTTINPAGIGIDQFVMM